MSYPNRSKITIQDIGPVPELFIQLCITASGEVLSVSNILTHTPVADSRLCQDCTEIAAIRLVCENVPLISCALLLAASATPS